jgi:prevent-host-death family protein
MLYNLDGSEVMVKYWQLDEAKNKFSELVDKALTQGPQVVSREGEEVVVVLSKKEYERLKKSQTSLVDFFQNSPLVGVDLDLDRDKSYPRDVEP